MKRSRREEKSSVVGGLRDVKSGCKGGGGGGEDRRGGEQGCGACNVFQLQSHKLAVNS